MGTADKFKLEFGNLVCKFGHHNMLDYADRIFLPAILKTKNFTYHQRGYDIIDPVAHEFEGRPYVAFRIVAHKVLESDQRWNEDEDEIERVNESLKTAPSSSVLITLGDHRIVVSQEARWAPRLGTVGSILRHLIGRQLRQFILDEADAFPPEERPHKRKELRDSLKLFVEATPFVEQQSLELALQGLSKITKIRLWVSRTNVEHGFGNILPPVQEVGEELLASKPTQVTFEGKEGMDKEVAMREVLAASAGGQAIVLVDGLLNDGTERSVGSEKNTLVERIATSSAEPLLEKILRMFRRLVNHEKHGVVPRRPLLEGELEAARDAVRNQK